MVSILQNLTSHGGRGCRKALAAAVLGAALAIAPAAAVYAHHGMGGEFDAKQVIEISGTIHAVKWANPHVRLELMIDGGKSTQKIWRIDSNSVASLSRLGVTKDIVPIGAAVKMAGNPAINGEPMLYMTHLLLPDGREVGFQDNGKPRWNAAVQVANGDFVHGKVLEQDFSKRPATIFSVWTTFYGNPGSHNTQPAETSGYPATERGRQEAAKIDMMKNHPLADCKPKGMPAAMFAPYPVQILKDGNDIKIRMEEYDAERLIHMTAKHDDSRATPSRLGYSTGVWEGDKLVVKTTKIDYRFLAIQSRPTPVVQGPRVSVVETFQLAEDHNRLNYTSTITDPDYLTKPLVVAKFWQYVPGAKVNPYNCTK